MIIKSECFHAKENSAETISNIIKFLTENYYYILLRTWIWLSLRDNSDFELKKHGPARPKF